MLTVRYRLTPEDLAELDREARGGWFRRILETPARGFLGGLGLMVVWQAFFLFPREHWFGNLAIAVCGALSCGSRSIFPDCAGFFIALPIPLRLSNYLSSTES